MGLDQHLRHRRRRPALQGGADQHDADRRLPRRRPAGGDLHHRAAVRRGGARDEARSGRAAPPQHDPARADAVQEPARPDLRQRRVREDPRPGPRARRLERLRRAARRVEGARPAARPRHRLVPRMDRRQRARGEGQRRRHARRHHRDLLGDAGDGPGHRDQLRAARGRRLRRADRQDPHRPGRHRRAATASAAPARARSSPAARRCGSRPSERSTTRKTLAGEALEAAAADIEYRAGRFAVVGTDVGIDLFALAGKQPGQRIHLEASAIAGGPTWPNACHVCEVEVDPESGDVRVVAYSSVNDIGRVVSPTIARGQVDGGADAGPRPGAVRAGRLRRRQRPARHRQLHGLRGAARRPRHRLPHRVRHLDPVPAQRARRQGRRRARHDRRDAGGDERRHRRARPRRPRPRRRERCRCRRRPSGCGRCCARGRPERSERSRASTPGR